MSSNLVIPKNYEMITSINYGGGFAAPPEQICFHSLQCKFIPGIGPELAKGYFRNPSNKSSCHAIADPSGTVDTVPIGQRAWHCGNGNATSLGLEHAGMAEYSREEWLVPLGVATLKNGAVRAAKFAVQLGWRRSDIRWLSVDQVRNNERGLCTHNDMRLARGGTTHWDTGPGFPYDLVLQWVLEAFDIMTGSAPVPVLPPKPQPEPEPDTLEWIMGLPGAPANLTYQQAVADIVNGVVSALSDFNLPTDPKAAAAIPRTTERAVSVAWNRVNHGQNYDGSKKPKK